MCLPMTPENAPILADVARERLAQDAKWGQQSWPTGTGPDVVAFFYTMKELADNQRKVTDARNHAGTVTWMDILLEEVLEAGAEEYWPAIRSELVQAAAVIVACIEDHDRRQGQHAVNEKVNR